MTASSSIYARLDSRIRSMIDKIVEWSRTYDLYLTRQDALEKAIISVTYSDWCSPPESTNDQLILSAELLTIFFYFDDLSQVESFTFETDTRSFFAGTLTEPSKPIMALESYLRHLACYGDTGPLERRLLCSFEVFSDERNIEPGAVRTVAETDRIRMGSVFVAEYNINWKIAMGLMDTVDCREFEDMSARLVYLVNDIASIEKDTLEGEANYVLALHHESNISISDATTATVRMIQGYYQTLNRAQACDPTNRLLQYLMTVVEGNIFATIELSKVRYGKLPEALVHCCHVLSRDGRASRWVDYASYFANTADPSNC